MAGDRVAGPPLDLAQGALELVVGERLDLAAAVANEMVMMLAVGVERLEARDAGAEKMPRALVRFALQAARAGRTPRRRLARA